MADKNLMPPPQPPVHGHDYDPRRLYPFGLSPIPELPSGLASEVSSVCSYSPTPSDEFADDSETDDENRSRSIMYSGSCSSVKSVEEITVAENPAAEEESDTDESSTEQDSSSEGSDTTDMDSEDEETDEEQEEVVNVKENLYSSQVMTVTHQKTFQQVQEQTNEMSEAPPEPAEPPSAIKETSAPPTPSPVSSRPTSSQSGVIHEGTEKALFNATAAGAATASEIFRHLQATRGKEEVTQELAKILNVLQTTLKQEDSESSSSSESSDSSDNEKPKETGPNIAQSSVLNKVPAAPLGKPPRHPNAPLHASKSDVSTRIGPEIQQRIKELGAVKPGSGKEEMHILSKILVTLLCSCKTASASGELRKIIRQFKDAAKEASDEVGDDLDKISRSCSRTSSKASTRRRRKARSRRSSANSSNSHSEAESLTNTLTPCNTDSKSSGTEDEGVVGDKVAPRAASVPRSSNATPVSASRLQFKVTVNGKEPVSKPEPKDVDPNVSVTISLPRQTVEEEEDSSTSSESESESESEEEEWEWEEEEEDTNKRDAASDKRHDSTSSSHEISLADEKSAAENSHASSTVRKLLTDMECGAYNSDSLCSPGHSGQSDVGNSERSPASPQAEDSDSDSTAEWSSGEEQGKANTEPLVFTHLQETFNVLNGAYKIITGNIQEDEYIQEQNKNGSFVSSTTTATVQPVMVDHSSMSCSATIDKTTETPAPVTGSRPLSRQKVSRPASRQRQSRPSSKMSARPDEEEEWGDSDDWEYEYYYEEEEEEPESATPVVEKPEPQPHTRIIPIIIEEPAKAAPPSVSRPGSRQRRLVSRPNSRQGSRPASRNASRPCSRMKNGGLNGVKEEAEFDNEEDEDWEWEYYYEGEEDELRCMSPAATTAPTTRATSPFPNGGEKLRDDRPTVKTPLLSNAVEMTGSPHWEEAGRVSVAGVPIADNASETIHNDLLNPSKELSVALAAEYLGQKAEDVAAALPAGFAADTTSPNSVSRLSAEGGGSRKKEAQEEPKTWLWSGKFGKEEEKAQVSHQRQATGRQAGAKAVPGRANRH